MNHQIKRRFSKDILKEATSRYGIMLDEVHLLGDFDSFVYDFERGGQHNILRISHSSRRSASLVRGELAWINHLVKGDASVCDVVLSKSGQLVEIIDDGHGEEFIAAGFLKAQGKSPRAGEWAPNSIEEYGKLLGRIHQLSRTYSPPYPEWIRPDWDSPEMLDVEKVLSGKDEGVLDKFKELISTLSKLPKNDDCYGLIHQDAHGENLAINETGRITLFDFFDCAYSWFMNDIAIVLFYAAMWEEDRTSFTDDFMRHFLAGYRFENALDASWLVEIQKFLKLREIDLYSVILREFGNDWESDPWNAGYMRGRRERIIADTPYIDYDFSILAE